MYAALGVPGRLNLLTRFLWLLVRWGSMATWHRSPVENTLLGVASGGSCRSCHHAKRPRDWKINFTNSLGSVAVLLCYCFRPRHRDNRSHTAPAHALLEKFDPAGPTVYTQPPILVSTPDICEEFVLQTHFQTTYFNVSGLRASDRKIVLALT